jgi:hypothetical protein
MSDNLIEIELQGRCLPIRPMKLKGKIIRNVPISKLKPGNMREIDIPNAIVSYIDILGFSEKKEDEDIKYCLLDFSGPLILASREYTNVRFNIFSDCAFLSAPQDYAKDLLSSIRFSFNSWIADGILVRGGIAKGGYSEINSAAQEYALDNTNCSIFSGSAVIDAVRLEGSGPGALLFANNECADFFRNNYKEPIFILNSHQAICWSDEKNTIFSFLCISFLRLLKILSSDSHDVAAKSTKEKLINNINYCRFIKFDEFFPLSIISIILSSPVLSSKIRETVLNILDIKENDLYKLSSDIINNWFARQDIQLLFGIADMDSSIPKSTIISDMIKHK